MSVSRRTESRTQLPSSISQTNLNFSNFNCIQGSVLSNFKMHIPIQRESSESHTSTYTTPNTTKRVEKSSFSSKKEVRITPKVTEVEIIHPNSRPSRIADSHFQTEKKATQNNWSRNGRNSNDVTTLTMFDETKLFSEPAWVKEEMNKFFTPALSTFPNRSGLMKHRFDDFMQDNMQLGMNRDHPIQIDSFTAEQDKYVLTLNVQQFKPEELEVKVTDDVISIAGKHEEKQDDQNFSCQEYSRKHSLPPGVKADDVRCQLGNDGILRITAPRKEPLPALERERNIPIRTAGVPSIRV